MRVLLGLLGLLAAACVAEVPRGQAIVDAPSLARSEAAPEPPQKEALVMNEFVATVRIDAQPGGKRFQGVWLEREDGERLVAAYRPEPWLQAFQDQRVRVTGEVYAPMGQAIRATHFRVATLRLADAQTTLLDARLVGIGPEQRLQGRFEDRIGAPGTKLEGEPYRVFLAEGGLAYLLARAPDDVAPGSPVEVVAREATLSPFVARRGGLYLWVLSVKPVAP